MIKNIMRLCLLLLCCMMLHSCIIYDTYPYSRTNTYYTYRYYPHHSTYYHRHNIHIHHHCGRNVHNKPYFKGVHHAHRPHSCRK